MSIVVRHDQPGSFAALGGLATAVGQGQAATRDADRDEARTRFLLGLREQQRSTDINAALRIRTQDIEQRQYNQNLAMQDARQQTLLANNEMNRQAQLESQAMREQGDALAQQQQQAFEWQQKSVMSVDEQVGEQMKAVQQLNLNPEGKRILNEKMGKLREVQQQRGSYRPGPYQELLTQWLGDLQGANLDAYVVQEPTAQEKVYQGMVPLQGQQVVPGQPLPPGTYRSLKGTRNGVESWETITIPKEDTATTAERFERDSVPAPDGGRMIWNPEKQDWTHIPPAKAEKSEKPIDTSKYLKEAVNQLRADHAASQVDSETKTPFRFNPQAAKQRAREIMQLEQDLEAEMAAEVAPEELADDAPSGNLLQGTPDLLNAKRPQTIEEVMVVQPGEVFFWNGQYARMESDGTVTVIE